MSEGMMRHYVKDDIDVEVWYDYSDPEPDVNWPGGLEIHGVFPDYLAGAVCILGTLSAEEIESLEMAVIERLGEQHEQ